MSSKKIAWCIAVVLSSFSCVSQANIVIENHTNYYGTGKMDFSPCSSVSDSGVLKPKSRMEIQQSVVDSFCGIFDCKVKIYMSPNCGGKPIAEVKVNKKKNIVSIRSFPNGVVRVSGRGSYGAMDPA